MSAAATFSTLQSDAQNQCAGNAIRRADEPARDTGQQLEQLQQDLVGVQQELAELQHRDQALRFHAARLDEELRLAARVQRDFLPKTLPQVGRIRMQALYRPAGFVSGDLYDVMRLDETHVGIYMADAVGHGMPAALLTMFLKSAWMGKEILPDGYRLLSPGQVLARLNEALVGQNLSQATFATGVYAVVDTESLRITLARGGHPAPLRLRTDGTLDPIDAEGSLLGIFSGESFREVSVQLSAGDRVFFFTDGVEVAFSHDRAIDTQQWQQQILSRRSLSSAAMIHELNAALQDVQLRDDLTLIIMDVI